MNKKEYQRKHAELVKMIALAAVDVKKLDSAFKMECQHPSDKLFRHKNTYEDEYGKWMESWTDFDYKCERCGTELIKVKQDNLPKSIAEIRQRMREKNEI